MSEPRKLFSYAEARALVPEVRRLTGEAHRTLAVAGLDPGQPDQNQGREVLGRWATELRRLGLTVRGPALLRGGLRRPPAHSMIPSGVDPCSPS